MSLRQGGIVKYIEEFLDVLSAADTAIAEYLHPGAWGGVLGGAPGYDGKTILIVPRHTTEILVASLEISGKCLELTLSGSQPQEDAEYKS